MSHLQLIVAMSCFCFFAQATTINQDNVEMERFTAADSKSARLSTVYKTIRDSVGAPASRPPSNVVYGKSKSPRPPQAYVAPNLKGKPILNKFKPSQEDQGYNTEPVNTYGNGYKPSPQETAALQKYMQRYASQVLAAQKYSAQLSEAQKQVLSADPFKKYTATNLQKYKFIPVSQEVKLSQTEKLKDYDTVEITTERYQAQQTKVQKSPPKKAYSYDNTQQPSDYKYTSQDSNFGSQQYAEPEKSSWSSYEPYQYGVMSPEKSAEFSKITGYKIPAATSISVGHSIENKEEEKGYQAEEEEHYPHHEPKYEYMYQIHDPEKHNNFGHSEARKGKTTWGRYYVQLPDGRLETVKYWVDKSGYHAEVEFKGEAKHPSHKEYVHQEEKSYPQTKELGLGGHAEANFNLGGHMESSYGLSEPVEEY